MGITNAPQGGGSSGSGEWVKRTANNDWKDLFTIENQRMIALKDMYFYYRRSSDDTVCSAYIPKGTSQPYETFIIPITAGVGKPSTNQLRISNGLKITSSNYTSGISSIILRSIRASFTTDGSSVSISISENNDQIQKYEFEIWTRD